MSLNKYFIAIVLPEPLLSKVEALKQDLFSQYRLKGALRCPSHITLHRPFIWKAEKEALLIEKLTAFRFEPKFNIELRHFGFFEPRVIYLDVLPNENLNAFHKQLKTFAKKELQLFNEYDDLRAFKPHVTIASRDLKKDLFYALKEKFSSSELSLNFSFTQFSLLKFNKIWEEIARFDI
jgi:2'-5' RNA ligase